jgi:threonine dehydrogenase-like Zn-dependent dehydrogenase
LRKLPRSGDRVLVLGAGIIGLSTLQSLRALAPDAHVTVLARYAHQGETAERLGADEIVGEIGDPYAKMAHITEAKHYRGQLNRGMLLGGFDIVYDCVGSSTAAMDALRWTRAGGTVVMVGFSLDFLKFDATSIWFQEVDLIGSRTFGAEHLDGRQLHTFDLVIEMLQEGALKADGLITHRFPFEDHRSAIATSMNKRTGAIKVTLTYP